MHRASQELTLCAHGLCKLIVRALPAPATFRGQEVLCHPQAELGVPAASVVSALPLVPSYQSQISQDGVHDYVPQSTPFPFHFIALQMLAYER